jgi:eukaryotic-like serine/threonine-protein kinase
MQYIAGQSLDKVLDDIRRLRHEKEGRATGETLTLASRDESQGENADVAVVANARCETDQLRRTVTLGLLTGRFAITGVDGDSGDHDKLRPSEVPVGPTVELGALGAPTRRFVSELRQADGTFRPSHEPSAAPETADDPKGPPPHDTTSSLTGKTNIRYYREVARLGAQVGDALAYAHKRGVLHRDIKPPNLIMDALGNIWVTDFGLAKFEEGDDVSKSQDLVGTLRYMAPERFRGVSDRRGDVYALGATLYELLTLRQAFEGKDQLELIQRIENQPPVPPRQLEPGIPRDLETIVLKALAKEPANRFSSAEELAAELRRFVESRPIRSRPIPYYQQFWRWCKRNPGLATANVAAAVLMTTLAIVSTVAAFMYRDRNHQVVRDSLRIQRAENETREQLFAALQAQARAGRFSRQMGQRFDSLKALVAAAAIARDLKLPRDRLEPLRDEAIAALALPDLEPAGRVITQPAGVIRTAFDATMTRYALRFRDGTISVRRVADDGEVARFQARGDREFWVFGLSPDGRYLATTHFPGTALTVWDIDRRAIALEDPGNIWRGARFSTDSRRIAVAQGDGDLLVYDLATGRPGRRWPARASHPAFRPDGAQIAVVDNESNPPTCRILEGESGRLVRTFPLRVAADDVAWNPDGTALATAARHPDHNIDLWDAGTGIRRATLEGHDNAGLSAAFHPAGTLLASNGYEERLRLWDAVLGRPWLSVSGFGAQFSQDGRIVVGLEGKLTTYQVDPALEYRTFAHASREPMNYQRPSVRHDGRVLAVGTDRGAVLWDLARGTELAFLPIGNAWHLMFEPSGDLITSGSMGVQRWPIQLDINRSEFRLGPPRQLQLPAGHCGIAGDRLGRIVAKADHTYAYVATPERTIRVGPLDDCRNVAVSPDGQWLATASLQSGGARVWRITDGAKVAELPIDGVTPVAFSPDGKWLVAGNPRLRRWEVGTWREVQQVTDLGVCFSPDGRLTVVVDSTRVIRLVEFETGRTLARMARPDLRGVQMYSFSPDGSRLVVTTNDRPSPAVHVWNLRAIRKRLAGMGLDWEAPAYSEHEPADPSAPPIPPLQVDFGKLAEHLEQNVVPAEDLVARYTERLKALPDDPDSLHQRGHALLTLRRFDQALADFSAASAIRPRDGHLMAWHGVCLLNLKRYAQALDQFELAFQTDPGTVRGIPNLGVFLNNLAWKLVTGPLPQRDPALASRLATFSVALAPGEQVSLNTLGVALYRAGKVAEAITTLEKSLDAGKGQYDAFDLFFLAMAHHRLSHCTEARACYERAVRWVSAQKGLTAQQAHELAGFRAEAEAVLEGPSDALPADVFAKP